MQLNTEMPDVRYDQNGKAIDFPSPVWKSPQGLYGNNRWIVFSPKLKRKIILYSDLEYDHWILVEATPSINSFCEQPRRVRVQLPSGHVTTVFDMWILLDTGHQEYREVKYLKELLKATSNLRTYRQIQAQKKWCEINKINHTVMTEDVIQANPIFLSNWKVILSNLACTQDVDLSSHIENVSSLLIKSTSTTLRAIESSFPTVDRCLIRASIFTLIHRGHLKAPLDVLPLTASTQIDMVL